MAHSGTPVGKATAHPLRTLSNHRKLIATIFPRAVTAAVTDGPSAIEDQEIIHCAASQGILLSLLALPAGRGFTYDMPDRFGRTPLHWAAEQGHCNVVLALLRAGVSVDPHSHRKATPIMLAASRGHVQVVGLLLQHRAGESDCRPLNRHRCGIEHWRSTALHCAAAAGHVRVIERLLDAGFDRGQHDGAGLTAAEVSARQSHSTSAAITHLLLPRDMGGKLVHDYVNMTMEDVPMVSGLVKGGAFLDWQDASGDTPLHRAVYFKHIIISRILLQAGAKTNIRGHASASPLHVAAFTGCVEIVADLVTAGADMEPRVVGDFSPLHLAVVKNRLNVVRLLLNAGAYTENHEAYCGQTPLSWACRGCLSLIVRALVEAGADVESRSSAGLTPLHWACRFIDFETVEVLLNAGADPGAVDPVAAKDAVASSSSRSGTIASMPVAIDVIGLGYPLDPTEHLMRSFTGGSVTLAARRLDLVSVKRIELALKGAKKERSWRRRGWLVFLADRCVAMGVRDRRAAATCRGCPSRFHPAVTLMRHVNTGVEQPPCVRQKRAACFEAEAYPKSDNSDSQHPQGNLSNGVNVVGKRLRTVRSTGMMTRAASLQQGQARDNDGTQANVAVSLSVLVNALLGLNAVEVGVFRDVVMYI